MQILPFCHGIRALGEVFIRRFFCWCFGFNRNLFFGGLSYKIEVLWPSFWQIDMSSITFSIHHQNLAIKGSLSRHFSKRSILSMHWLHVEYSFISYTQSIIDVSQSILVILDGNNYNYWTHAIRSFLKSRILWRYVIGNKKL